MDWFANNLNNAYTHGGSITCVDVGATLTLTTDDSNVDCKVYINRYKRTTIEITNFPAAISTRITVMINGIGIPATGGAAPIQKEGLSNIPLELWTENSAGAFLEGRVLFDYVAPIKIVSSGGAPTFAALSNLEVQ